MMVCNKFGQSTRNNNNNNEENVFKRNLKGDKKENDNLNFFLLMQNIKYNLSYHIFIDDDHRYHHHHHHISRFSFT